MTPRPRPNAGSPKPRRSRTVWPIVFGILLLLTLLVILAFSAGWIDVGGDLQSD